MEFFVLFKSLLTSKNNYVHSLVSFLFMFFILTIQNNIIYPIEKLITNSPVIDYVSILYLPHGTKIILFFIYRHISIFPIFLATYFYGFTLDFNIVHLAGSFIGIFGIFLSFFLCSFLLQNETVYSKKYVLWRLLVVVSLFSALLNSIFQSMLISFIFKDFNLNLLFLFGDIMGSIIIIFLMISLRSFFLRLIINEK